MLTKQFIKQSLVLISAAFSLVAALAWNSAIQALILRIYPEKVAGVKSQFIYAIVITLLTVLITIWVGTIDKKIERRTQTK